MQHASLIADPADESDRSGSDGISDSDASTLSTGDSRRHTTHSLCRAHALLYAQPARGGREPVEREPE